MQIWTRYITVTCHYTDPNIRYDIDFSGNWRLLKSKMDDFGGGRRWFNRLSGGSEGECGRIVDNLRKIFEKTLKKWFRFVKRNKFDRWIPLFPFIEKCQGKEECSVLGIHPAAICLPETGRFTGRFICLVSVNGTKSYFDSLEKISEPSVEMKRFSRAS